MEQIRLNKYLAHSGVCSRRDADKLIEEGKVLVNGQRAEHGTLVDEKDEIVVSGEKIQGIRKPVVLAFYKPVGVVCTERDPHAEQVIADLVDYPVRVTYAGRLDKDSEGLLLMTNQGELADKIMHAGSLHEKEYVVTVDRQLQETFLKKMREGVELKELGETTRPCLVKQEGARRFRIVLTQGLNRQIRRMCQALGFRVVTLKRVRIMNIHLGKLQPGEFRKATKDEWKELVRRVYGKDGVWPEIW